jgi:Tfp pilus assembly PilM family ATPase/Tfp pilus assembly protein PilN
MAMFNKKKDYLIISLVDECLKFAHVRVNAADKQIIGVAKKDVHGVAPEQLPGVAKSLVAELGLNKPTAIYALSASSVTTKNIEVPSIDPAEIKSIIDLQAGRHTPYSREEILIGYINIGVFQRNYTKVLLVIVNRDQILKQVNVLMQAGIGIEKVVFAPEAAALFYAQVMKVNSDDLPVGIIDLSHDTTDFMVQWNKTIVTSRSIPVGMNQLIKEGEPARQKLLAELGQSVEVYQNEDIGKPPSQYVLTSDDAKLQELKPALMDKLKTNINVMPYLDHMTASQPVMLKLVSEYNDDSFLNVMAVGKMLDQLRLDLTPDEIRSQRAMEEKGRQVIVAAFYGLVLLCLVCAVFFTRIYFKGIYLDKLKADYEAKEKVVKVLDHVAQKTQIIKDYTSDRLITLDTLKTLYDLIPEEIYLQAVTLEDNGTITIQGVSESMSRVFNLVTALEESTLFKNVKTKSTATKQERGKDVAAFELAFRLESAPDEEEVEEEAVKDGTKVEKGDKAAKGKDAKKDAKAEKADKTEKPEKATMDKLK